MDILIALQASFICGDKKSKFAKRKTRISVLSKYQSSSAVDVDSGSISFFCDGITRIYSST